MEITRQTEIIEASENSLPPKRKIPKRLKDCFGYGTSDTSHFPDTPKSHYRCIYLDVLDNVIQSIKNRFNQPDFQKYMNLQELLLKAVKGEKCEKELESVKGPYKGDFNAYSLDGKLELLPQVLVTRKVSLGNMDVKNLIDFFQKLERPERLFLSEVIKVVKILLDMPATNAISERSFPSLKRVKTYLRSTTSDTRLNNIMTLHVHKDRMDMLNLNDIASEFIGNVDSRRTIFGNAARK